MILNKLLFWPLRHCSIVNYKLQRAGNISVKQHSRKGHRFNVVSASATERFHFLDTFTNTLYIRTTISLPVIKYQLVVILMHNAATVLQPKRSSLF